MTALAMVFRRDAAEWTPAERERVWNYVVILAYGQGGTLDDERFEQLAKWTWQGLSRIRWDSQFLFFLHAHRLVRRHHVRFDPKGAYEFLRARTPSRDMFIEWLGEALNKQLLYLHIRGLDTYRSDRGSLSSHAQSVDEWFAVFHAWLKAGCANAGAARVKSEARHAVRDFIYALRAEELKDLQQRDERHQQDLRATLLAQMRTFRRNRSRMKRLDKEAIFLQLLGYSAAQAGKRSHRPCKAGAMRVRRLRAWRVLRAMIAL